MAQRPWGGWAFATWSLEHTAPPALFPQTERDVSVRQRAADLLYAMCDRSNAKQIVSEMLRYLETADYAIREEIVSLWRAGGGAPGPEGAGLGAGLRDPSGVLAAGPPGLQMGQL